MEFDQMSETLGTLPAAEQKRWMLAALGILAAMALALFVESRYFKRSHRTGSRPVRGNSRAPTRRIT